MSMFDASFFSKLQTRPAVLFLGQHHLSLERGSDPLLEEVLRKFGPSMNGRKSAYDDLFLLGQDSGENHLDWLRERCRRMLPSTWLEIIGRFPWSSVVTSAVDTLVDRALEVEWREIHPIFEDKINPFDPRNRRRLHLTHLFGSLGRIEPAERPPLSKLELIKKRPNAISLLGRLPEVVSPLGTLVVEGYEPKGDWLGIEDFYAVLDNLGDGQIHFFFSGGDDLRSDELVSLLVEGKKAIVHPESLASVLNKAEAEGFIDSGLTSIEAEARDSLTVGNRVSSIPLHLRTQLARSALILDDELLIPPPTISKDRLYIEFRDFLANSSGRPDWKGFARGFAFKRDFETELEGSITKMLKGAGSLRRPLILHGRTATGKTVACGSLAYKTKIEGKFPVLFIERKTNRPNFHDISSFCEWAENEGSAATLVIWDAMAEVSQYEELVRFLQSRGRKAVIIGTSYLIPDQKISAASREYYVEAKDRFGEHELPRLRKFVGGLDPNLEQYVDRFTKNESVTFLVALYRLLPSSRPKVQLGVVEEVGYAEEQIIRKSKSRPVRIFQSSMGTALINAGVATASEINLEEVIEVSGDFTTRIEEIIGLIMVPGSFGHAVPLEILIRAFDRVRIEELVPILRDIDIFTWTEDEVGNLFLGPRQALEARILVNRRLGSAEVEIGYATKLLLEIKDGTNSVENTELNFAVDLVRSLGPNGANPARYSRYWLTLSDVLRTLRTERGVLNPRLMLQEAFLRREYVIANTLPVTDSIGLLESAVETLEHAIDELPDDRRQNKLRSIMLVERAAVLGAKLQLLNEHKILNSDIRRIYEGIRASILAARTLDPDSFRPVDVLAWTSTALLKGELIDESTRLEITADLLYAFDSINADELGVEREQFERRRMEIGDVLDLHEMRDDAFDHLASIGSTAGLYLRARNKLKDVDLTEPVVSGKDLAACSSAMEYLNQNEDLIASDGRCLYLQLRLWWILKTSEPIFFVERQSVPFAEEDWLYLLRLVERIVQSGELYRLSSLLYLQAVSLFHLGELERSLSVFKEIAFEPEETQGRRRIVRSLLASNPNGTARMFNGTVRWSDGTKGEVFVEDLGRNIRFLPHDFNRQEIKVGETIAKFHIAFNFIGPIADPVRTTKRGGK
ncbi:MAG: hypothetical protein IPM25_16180 [Chloracidobacterium sp.]|nr:hypothetical protein [Chloracidobacterium sp.]